MLRAATILTLVLAFTMAEALAQEIRTVGGCRLRPGTLCVRLNLRGADLSGMNLRHSQFTGSMLGGANLSGANLDESDLNGVDARNANLQSTSLRRATARGARFDDANLSGAVLEKASRALPSPPQTGSLGSERVGRPVVVSLPPNRPGDLSNA